MPPGVQSRYLGAELHNLDGKLYLGQREPLLFDPDLAQRAVMVARHDTLQTLAAKFIGAPQFDTPFWWLVAEFSHPPVLDPTVPLTPGTTVYIPSRDRALAELLDPDRKNKLTI